MKVAFVVYNLTGGGAERVASLWMYGFSQRGHDVHVIMLDTHSEISYKIPQDVTIDSIDTNKGSNRYINVIRRLLFRTKRLKKVFTELKPDLVIAVTLSVAPLIYRAKGKCNFKVIGTDHNSFERPADAPISKELMYLKYEFSKRFDQMTVLTQADKDYIGDRLSNVTVLPNPLAFTPCQEIPPKDKIILAVGRYDVWYVKGFDLLLQAWGRIASKYPDWSLHIMGAGQNKNRKLLENLIKQNNVAEQTELKPYLPDPTPAYRRASIFCQSSRYEGFGMVLIEAMSQGCACVSCDYKGRQREIIRNCNEGVICNNNGSESIGKALERLISDEEYRYSLQQNAIQRSADFKIENIMRIWSQILEKIGMEF